jgi:hypothetical protein
MSGWMDGWIRWIDELMNSDRSWGEWTDLCMDGGAWMVGWMMDREQRWKIDWWVGLMQRWFVDGWM